MIVCRDEFIAMALTENQNTFDYAYQRQVAEAVYIALRVMNPQKEVSTSEIEMFKVLSYSEFTTKALKSRKLPKVSRDVLETFKSYPSDYCRAYKQIKANISSAHDLFWCEKFQAIA